MYRCMWILALVLCGCAAAVPVPGATSPPASTAAATTSARTVTPQAQATPLPQANVAVSTSSRYQFTGMLDGIAYTYAVRFRPRGDYDGITYPNDHLLIRYSFANNGADAILFNHVVRDVSTLGELYVAPQSDGVIEIGLRAFAEPTDRVCPERDAPIVPRGSWLRAGDQVTEQRYVELPLKQFTPFDDCSPVPPMPPSSAPARICFGYVRPAGAVTIDDNGSVNLLSSTIHALVAAQQLLCSDNFSVEALQ